MPPNRKARKIEFFSHHINPECFNGIREVKLYGRENFMYETFQNWNKEYFDAVIESNRYQSLFGPYVPMILTIFSAFFLMMGAFLEIGGQLTPGQLIATITYFSLLGGPVRAVTGFANIYTTAKAAAERIFEIQDRIPTIVRDQEVLSP